MYLNTDMTWKVCYCCNTSYITVINLIQRSCQPRTDDLCAALMQWYAVKMTYQGMLSPCGTLGYSLSLSPSLTSSPAHCGWWRWCESRQMGLAARQQAVILYVCYWVFLPCSPLSHVSISCRVLSVLYVPVCCPHCSPYLLFPLLPQQKFPHFFTFPLLSPLPILSILLASAIVVPG